MDSRLLVCVTLLVLAGCTTDPPAVGETYEFVGPSGGQFLRGEVVELGDCRAMAEAEQNDGDLVGVMAQFEDNPDGPCAALLMEGIRPFAGPAGQPIGQMVWVLPVEQVESAMWQRTEAGAPPLDQQLPTGSRSLWLLGILFLFILGPVLMKVLDLRSTRRSQDPSVTAFEQMWQQEQARQSAGTYDRRQAEFAAEQQRWEQWQAERKRSEASSSAQPNASSGNPRQPSTGWSALSPEVAEAYYFFDLQPDATDEAIRQARRKLVARWHPDRFEHDDRMKARATEKLKRINQAYEVLVQHREER